MPGRTVPTNHGEDRSSPWRLVRAVHSPTAAASHRPTAKREIYLVGGGALRCPVTLFARSLGGEGCSHQPKPSPVGEGGAKRRMRCLHRCSHYLTATRRILINICRVWFGFPPYCWFSPFVFYGASRTSPPTMNNGCLIQISASIYVRTILRRRKLFAPTKSLPLGGEGGIDEPQVRVNDG